MPGEGGSVGDKTIAEVAVSMRRLLAAIDACKLSCSATYRNRLRGAVVTLDALANGGRGRADRQVEGDT